MKKLMKRTLRRARDPFRTSLRNSAARTEGDQARDEGRFADAAEAYSRHLQTYPRDVAIWIQMGHMLKDDRRLLEADYAYGKAVSLRPHDPEALLHSGSLKRALDKRQDAANLFVRAADTAMSPELAVEISAPDMAPFVPDLVRSQIAAGAARAVSSKLNGVTLIDCSGIVALPDHSLRFLTGDPLLVFTLPATARDTKISGLRLRMTATDPSRKPVGHLYIDYGFGFDPNDSFAITPPDGRADLDVVVALVAPGLIRSVRWDPDDKTNDATLEAVSFIPSLNPDACFSDLAAHHADDAAKTEDASRMRALIRKGGLSSTDAAKATRFLNSELRADPFSYELWRRRWIDPSRGDYERIHEMTAQMTRHPTFSFVMPTYNTPIPLLIECMDALLSQTYVHFEICVADDRSPDRKVYETLQRYAERDDRVKIVRREHNGHISSASNSALALATGDFIVLVDHDDLIPDYTLFVLAHYINQNPDVQILFSDEDKITISGEHFAPYFKGNFDPYLMYGHNMVSHLGVYRRDLLERIGGFRRGLEGSQDYDLLLRAWEIVGDDAIIHIPHVLYHWRAIPGSTAVSPDQKSYAIVAARSAISGHFERTGAPLLSVESAVSGNTTIKATRELETSISIIIPTRDGLEDLRACINSILERDHRKTEIIVVDNGSQERDTIDYFARMTNDGLIRVIHHDAPFNFSEINNLAADQATGEILCFLNNDTEVVSDDWLDRARVFLSMPKMGIVGARLLYPDGTLQHFGVHVGTTEHRVASHVHHGLLNGHGGYFGKALLTQQFSAVTAACLFIRREVFESVGGFDPELRVAYNDVDLCLKTRAAGLKVIADADLVLVHKESRTRGADTTGEKAARLDREAALMRSRWGKELDSDPFRSPNHDLDYGDFRLANPPRTPMPWRA